MMVAYFKFLEINTAGSTLGLGLMVRFVFRRLGFCKGFLIVQGWGFGFRVVVYGLNPKPSTLFKGLGLQAPRP